MNTEPHAPDGAPGATRTHNHGAESPGAHVHGPDCGHHHEKAPAHAHTRECCGQDHGLPHSHGDAVTPDHASRVEFTRRFFLFLELIVLVMWSVAMLWFYASGRIEKYLVGEGTFRIQVLVAGLVLAVLGWFNWSMRARNGGCGHDHGEGEDCGHDHAGSHSGHQHPAGHSCCGGEAHSHVSGTESDPVPAHAHSHSHEGSVSGRGLGLLLLSLSVSAAVALTPDDFSDSYKKNMLHAYASQPAGRQSMPEAYRAKPEGGGTGGLTIEVIEKMQPRNKDGNFGMDVMQLYYSGSDPEYAKVMKGQGVETIGQMVKDTAQSAPNRWRVFVLQVTCCAADARPYSLPVQFDGPVPELQEMGWYKIAGKIDYIEEKGGTSSILHAASAEPAVRPRDQRMLF